MAESVMMAEPHTHPVDPQRVAREHCLRQLVAITRAQVADGEQEFR